MGDERSCSKVEGGLRYRRAFRPLFLELNMEVDDGECGESLELGLTWNTENPNPGINTKIKLQLLKKRKISHIRRK